MLRRRIKQELGVDRLPGWLRGKESTCQCRRLKRCRFDPWVRKIPLEKEMATHSNLLTWEIPWIGELGGLQPLGSVAKSQTQLTD